MTPAIIAGFPPCHPTSRPPHVSWGPLLSKPVSHKRCFRAGSWEDLGGARGSQRGLPQCFGYRALGCAGVCGGGTGLRARSLHKSQFSGLQKPLADPSTVPPLRVGQFPAPLAWAELPSLLESQPLPWGRALWLGGSVGSGGKLLRVGFGDPDVSS